MSWKVVEKDKPLHVHCLTWSRQRAEAWIEKYGDSKIFMDKTLTRESFIAINTEESNND